MTTELAAAASNISKAFKGVPVFHEATITLPQGKIIGIQGPNGSGKSVLFKMLCGFIRPDAGEIYVNPQYKAGNEEFPSRVGIIIDRPGYLGGLTGLQNLKALARIKGVAQEADILAAMERVGLEPTLRTRVRNYSLGMKQKLAIAQAFMEDQQLLLLDEPFNGLDDTSTISIRNLMVELNHQGRTIVLTSHNQEDIDLLCHHVWRLNRQRFEQVDQ